jgi:hypothetical protein
MEIILGLIFVAVVAVVFFSRKPKELVEAEQAPYKVEESTPAVTAEPVVTQVAEQASEAMVESIAPVKKPRKPRATKPAAVKKAPAAKKTTRKPKAVK